MDVSERTTTPIGHLSSSTKNRQENKRCNFMIKSLSSSNTSNRFKLTMTPTRGEKSVASVSEMER